MDHTPKCAFCGVPVTGDLNVTLLTAEQRAENKAWADSFKGGVYHTGHCLHLELPTHACPKCYAEHPESHWNELG